MSLQTPEKVGKLQTALHAKAKGAPSYRFYLLYDKVYRADILAFAYRVCRANRGAPGVDGQSLADIEAVSIRKRRIYVANLAGAVQRLGRSAEARILQEEALALLDSVSLSQPSPAQPESDQNRLIVIGFVKMVACGMWAWIWLVTSSASLGGT